MYVRLGNVKAVHRPNQPGGASLSPPSPEENPGSPLDGPCVTYVAIPEDKKLSEVFLDITKSTGIWVNHSAVGRDEQGNIVAEPPTWVDSDMPGLADLLAAEYGCVVGAPDDLEATHHTDDGPPGVGPDGPIAGTPEGDRIIAAQTQATAVNDGDITPSGGSGGGAVTGLLFLFALAYFFLTRMLLRTSAGADWQAKVLGDTASTGTGIYASATYVGITTDTGAPASGDTTLTGELTGSGLARAQATFAHTAGAASYTLTKTFTSSDATTRLIHKAALFNASSGGTMPFESALTSDANIASGDTLTLTWTISI